jgi:hypothetical protein
MAILKLTAKTYVIFLINENNSVFQIFCVYDTNRNSYFGKTIVGMQLNIQLILQKFCKQHLLTIASSL